MSPRAGRWVTSCVGSTNLCPLERPCLQHQASFLQAHCGVFQLQPPVYGQYPYKHPVPSVSHGGFTHSRQQWKENISELKSTIWASCSTAPQKMPYTSRLGPILTSDRFLLPCRGYPLMPPQWKITSPYTVSRTNVDFFKIREFWKEKDIDSGHLVNHRKEQSNEYSRKGVCNKMCFCFWRPADKLGFNVGWMDYKLPSISSETKYFAGDKQDQETFHWTKNNDSTYNFISILEGQQQEIWTMCYAAELGEYLVTLTLCRSLSHCWHSCIAQAADTWLSWDATDTKASTIWILYSPSFTAGGMLPASGMLLHSPATLDPTASYENAQGGSPGSHSTDWPVTWDTAQPLY